MILSKNGDTVICASDLFRVVSQLYDSTEVATASTQSVNLHILREGVEMDVTVPLSLLSGTPSVHIVQWAGLTLQSPHRALFFHMKKIPQGIYIALRYNGSPAHVDGISAMTFITEVVSPWKAHH